jgi:hypothetical protein
MDVVALAHAHLLLNHVPTLGLVFGFGLFLFSLVRRDESLLQASLAAFFLVAIMAFPTFMTGYAARLAIRRHSGFSELLTEGHQGAAVMALMLIEITGAAAWVGLWQQRRSGQPKRWTVVLVMTLAIVTLGLVTRAANMGGEITHSEIRTIQDLPGAEAAIPADVKLFTTPSISNFVTEYAYVWPVCEVFHFIGLALLMGIVLVINLRILGVGSLKHMAYGDLHKLLPWAVAGFTFNAISGMVFFVAQPQTYTLNLSFDLKIIVLVLAGITVLYHTIFDAPWTIARDVNAPLTAKCIAAAQIFLWFGVLYFGRMIPYLTGGARAGSL